jgi:DNA-binding HxlR family transcriptional regulator
LKSEILKINDLEMKKLEKNYQNAQECPITIFMEKIGGKWKPVIVWLLLKNGTMRFNELDKAIKGVTQKMLSQQLKGLEEADIVQRVVYPVIPPKVEYSLTEKGKTLLELMEGIMQWSKINLQEK